MTFFFQLSTPPGWTGTLRKVLCVFFMGQSFDAEEGMFVRWRVVGERLAGRTEGRLDCEKGRYYYMSRIWIRREGWLFSLFREVLKGTKMIDGLTKWKEVYSTSFVFFFFMFLKLRKSKLDIWYHLSRIRPFKPLFLVHHISPHMAMTISVAGFSPLVRVFSTLRTTSIPSITLPKTTCFWFFFSPRGKS